MQGTIQPTHYRLCQCKGGSEACELFQRERGQTECRRRACVELEAKTESRLPDESKDPVSPTSSRTGFRLLLKPAKHVFLLGLLQA